MRQYVTQAPCHNGQDRVDGGVNLAGVGAAAPIGCAIFGGGIYQNSYM